MKFYKGYLELKFLKFTLSFYAYLGSIFPLDFKAAPILILHPTKHSTLTLLTHDRDPFCKVYTANSSS